MDWWWWGEVVFMVFVGLCQAVVCLAVAWWGMRMVMLAEDVQRIRELLEDEE